MVSEPSGLIWPRSSAEVEVTSAVEDETTGGLGVKKDSSKPSLGLARSFSLEARRRKW